MIASTTIGCVVESRGVSPSPDWITPRRFAMALALVIVGAFPAVIFGFQTFAYRDFATFGYSLALYQREAFWQGEIPLWNPLNCFGIPFLAQWNTMTLYPPSLIYILLPLPWSLNVFCLLHVFLAGMGMFYLCSRWTRCPLASAFGGLTYAFAGLLLISTVWPNILAVLGWLPWVLLAVERALEHGGKQVWIAALVAALQMLAGMPEYTLLTWVLVVGLWMARRPTWAGCRRLAAVVLIVAGLIAAQLLPFLELLLQSERDSMFDAGAWPLPLWGWANFFVPLFHSRATPQGVYYLAEQTLFTSYYVTLPAFVMGIYAVIFVRDRRVWFFSAVALIAMWLALGKAGYLYQRVLDAVPIFAFMRFPIKFVALIAVAVPILGAFGVAHWINSETMVPRHRRVLIALGGVCSLIIIFLMLYAHFRPLADHDGPAVWWNGLWRLLFLAAGTALLLAVKSYAENQKRFLWCSMALLSCLVLDSFTNAPKHHPTAPPSVYAPGLLATRISNPPPVGEGRLFVTKETHEFLLYGGVGDPYADLIGRRAGLVGNLNVIDGVATTHGFYAMYIPAAQQIWKQLFFIPRERFPVPLADFAGITHMTVSSNALEWAVRPSAMPLVTAGQMPRFRDAQTNLLGVIHRLFDPRTMVYLQDDARPFVTVTNKTEAKVLSQQVSAHKIEAAVEAAEPSLVVLSQAYYRPWKASVNDKPTPIFRANYAFQAVQVPAGRHVVKLIYKDRLFEFGALISIVSLGIVVVALLWKRRSDSGPIVMSLPCAAPVESGQ